MICSSSSTLWTAHITVLRIAGQPFSRETKLVRLSNVRRHAKVRPLTGFNEIRVFHQFSSGQELETSIFNSLHSTDIPSSQCISNFVHMRQDVHGSGFMDPPLARSLRGRAPDETSVVQVHALWPSELTLERIPASVESSRRKPYARMMFVRKTTIKLRPIDAFGSC